MDRPDDELLDTLILEDIENPEHPSDFESRENYSVLILRLPEVHTQGVGIRSFAYLSREGRCYEYDRKVGRFRLLGDFEDLHRTLDERIDRLIREIRQYHLEIDRLEDRLYEERTGSDFMSRWLTYKKEISLIHRLMFHATLSFELFVHHHRKNEGFNELAYADVLEHMGRIRDLASAAMDKLDHLHDFYRTRVDERMNRNMYWLTVISAIFLPLTLITGFFGMNTGGLPFTQDPGGTSKVLYLSLVLEGAFLVFFLLISRSSFRRYRRDRSR